MNSVVCRYCGMPEVNGHCTNPTCQHGDDPPSERDEGGLF